MESTSKPPARHVQTAAAPPPMRRGGMRRSQRRASLLRRAQCQSQRHADRRSAAADAPWWDEVQPAPRVAPAPRSEPTLPGSGVSSAKNASPAGALPPQTPLPFPARRPFGGKSKNPARSLGVAPARPRSGLPSGSAPLRGLPRQSTLYGRPHASCSAFRRDKSVALNAAGLRPVR
jgi:hypothetical protein